MQQLRFFLYRYGVIAQLILIQGGIYLIFNLLILIQPAWFNYITPTTFPWYTPWTILFAPFTILITPMAFYFGTLLYAVFELLWLYWIGILLRDFRSDRLIWHLYLGAVACVYGILLLLAFFFPSFRAPFWGAQYGNFAILAGVAYLIPHFKIPLFLIGFVPLRWIAIGWGVLSILMAPSWITIIGYGMSALSAMAILYLQSHPWQQLWFEIRYFLTRYKRR